MAQIPTTPGRSRFPTAGGGTRIGGFVDAGDMGANNAQQWGQLGQAVHNAGNTIGRFGIQRYETEARTASNNAYVDYMKRVGEEENRLYTLKGADAKILPHEIKEAQRVAGEMVMKGLDTPRARELFEQQRLQYDMHGQVQADKYAIAQEKAAYDASEEAFRQTHLEDIAAKPDDGVVFSGNVQYGMNSIEMQYRGYPPAVLNRKKQEYAVLAIKARVSGIAEKHGPQAALDWLNSGVAEEVMKPRPGRTTPHGAPGSKMEHALYRPGMNPDLAATMMREAEKYTGGPMQTLPNYVSPGGAAPEDMTQTLPNRISEDQAAQLLGRDFFGREQGGTEAGGEEGGQARSASQDNSLVQLKVDALTSKYLKEAIAAEQKKAVDAGITQAIQALRNGDDLDGDGVRDGRSDIYLQLVQKVGKETADKVMSGVDKWAGYVNSEREEAEKIETARENKLKEAQKEEEKRQKEAAAAQKAAAEQEEKERVTQSVLDMDAVAEQDGTPAEKAQALTNYFRSVAKSEGMEYADKVYDGYIKIKKFSDEEKKALEETRKAEKERIEKEQKAETEARTVQAINDMETAVARGESAAEYYRNVRNAEGREFAGAVLEGYKKGKSLSDEEAQALEKARKEAEEEEDKRLTSSAGAEGRRLGKEGMTPEQIRERAYDGSFADKYAEIVIKAADAEQAAIKASKIIADLDIQKQREQEWASAGHDPTKTKFFESLTLDERQEWLDKSEKYLKSMQTIEDRNTGDPNRYWTLRYDTTPEDLLERWSNPKTRKDDIEKMGGMSSSWVEKMDTYVRSLSSDAKKPPVYDSLDSEINTMQREITVNLADAGVSLDKDAEALFRERTLKDYNKRLSEYMDSRGLAKIEQIPPADRETMRSEALLKYIVDVDGWIYGTNQEYVTEAEATARGLRTDGAPLVPANLSPEIRSRHTDGATVMRGKDKDGNSVFIDLDVPYDRAPENVQLLYRNRRSRDARIIHNLNSDLWLVLDRQGGHVVNPNTGQVADFGAVESVALTENMDLSDQDNAEYSSLLDAPAAAIEGDGDILYTLGSLHAVDTARNGGGGF